MKPKVLDRLRDSSFNKEHEHRPEENHREAEDEQL